MKMLCFMLSNYFPVDYISVDVSDRILALIFFVYDLSYSIILRSMAVSSGVRLSGEATKTSLFALSLQFTGSSFVQQKEVIRCVSVRRRRTSQAT